MPAELTPELLADQLRPSDPRLSPDGRWLAAVVAPAAKKDEHPVSAIWLAEPSGSTPARQLTSGLAEDSHPRWSPDSRQLAFLSDRAKRGTQQVQLLTLDGGEARALTDEPGGVADLCWLPGEGPRIAYLAIDAREQQEQERREREHDDAQVYGEFWPRARIVVLDLASSHPGGDRRRIDAGDRHVAAMAPSPDGRRLAVTLWPTPEIDWFAAGAELAVVDLESGALASIVRDKPGFAPSSLAWDRAGQALYLVANAGHSPVGSSQLWRVEARAGAEPRLLTTDAPFCVEEVERPAEREEILALVAEDVESSIYAWRPGTGAFERLSRFPGGLHELSVSADGGVIASVGAMAEQPFDLYAGPPNGELRRVSDFGAAWEGLPLGPQEVLTWQRAGFTLDGILIWPPNKSRADGPLPTIVAIHGGPYGRWPNEFLGHRFGRWLAAQGYLVFLPNPRGGAGHGHAFAEAVLHTVGNEDYRDIMVGVDLLVEQGLADNERLGVGGWSQGGFMTAWIVGHNQRFKAAVMGAGVSDWGMMIATSDIPSYETEMGGGNPYTSAGPHTFDAQSPISYVANAGTPTLILHGEKDERVPVSQGIFFHRGLRRHNVPTELVVYPREPHGIQERQHQIDLARRIAAWYRRWIPAE